MAFFFFFIFPPGYIRNSSSLSPRGYPSASTPQQSSYGGSGGMTGGYGTVPMTSLGVPGSPGFSSASPTSTPYSKTIPSINLSGNCAIEAAVAVVAVVVIIAIVMITELLTRCMEAGKSAPC